MRRRCTRPPLRSARRGSMVRVLPWQRPSSAPAPPQGAPGGSGQLGTPRKRPAHWAPSHCLGCSSQPPPKSPISPPLPFQARLNVDALAEWLGTHQEGLSKLVQVQNELLDDLAVLQQVSG